MKRRIRVLTVMPELYALRGSNYDNFLTHVSADEMARRNWHNLGVRMTVACSKVAAEIGLPSAKLTDAAKPTDKKASGRKIADTCY